MFFQLFVYLYDFTDIFYYLLMLKNIPPFDAVFDRGLNWVDNFHLLCADDMAGCDISESISLFVHNILSVKIELKTIWLKTLRNKFSILLLWYNSNFFQEHFKSTNLSGIWLISSPHTSYMWQFHIGGGHRYTRWTGRLSHQTSNLSHPCNWLPKGCDLCFTWYQVQGEKVVIYPVVIKQLKSY